ncbi:phenylalanine--tRNA ligase subunit alpha [Nitrospirota bacterium]
MSDLKDKFLSAINSASTSVEAENVRLEFLGKKGLLTQELKKLSSLPPEERKSTGMELNVLKGEIAATLEVKKEELKLRELEDAIKAERLDVTMPGKRTPLGRAHPVNTILERITDIFISMGFGVEEGPEVESDYYNFESLNFPKEHPARDMQDTFFVSDEVLLRTHTSPVQIRAMHRLTPPLRVIAPGKVYRCDADISHTPMFHQVEGLMVGEDVSFGHLKGMLETFIHAYFGPEIPVRFRPSFFPFTEPSAEVDMGCIFCDGKGCRICQKTGWIEILGAGMVHPNVLRMGGVDPDKYTGYAFGMGIERVAMLTYSIDDIRMLFESDIRFLAQF